MATTVSFKTDILPLFTEVDIDHMEQQGVQLNDYSYMSTPANAGAVYDQLSSKQMPPSYGGGGGPWPDSDIALFKSWIDDGYQP